LRRAPDDFVLDAARARQFDSPGFQVLASRLGGVDGEWLQHECAVESHKRGLIDGDEMAYLCRDEQFGSRLHLVGPGWGDQDDEAFRSWCRRDQEDQGRGTEAA
jgi:hypothetical protein